MLKEYLQRLKPFLSKYYAKSKPTLIILGILLALIGLFYLYYLFISIFLPTFAAKIIVALTIKGLIFGICKIAAYPGYLFYWKRNCEHHYLKVNANKLLRKILLIKRINALLTENSPWNNLFEETVLRDIKKVAENILMIFERQIAHKTIKPRQRYAYNLLKNLKDTLSATDILIKNKDTKFSFWDFLEGDSLITGDLEGNVLKLADPEKFDIIMHICDHLIELLESITKPKTKIAQLKGFLFDDCFGSLDQIREEVGLKYKTKNIQITVEKNVKIDCLFLFGSNPNQKDYQDLPIDSKKPIMIICCPNAAYYELMCIENDWIKYYVNAGVDLFLWNYRGYARSGGNPSPEAARKDGEAIVDYIRSVLEPPKLGIHGLSIGGVVATHVAKRKGIEFLCADRTFSSLSKIGEMSVTKFAGTIFRISTLWDDNIVMDFVDASCYKVLTFDPRDEIVHMLASLKAGITRKIVEKRIGYLFEPISPVYNPSSSIFSIDRLYNKIKQMVHFLRKESFEYSVDSSLKKSYGILGKDQTLALYAAFNRIMKLIPELSGVVNMRSLRRISANNAKVLDSKKDASGKKKNIEIEMSTNISTTDNSFSNIDLKQQEVEDYTLGNDYLIKSCAKPSYENFLTEDCKAESNIKKFLDAVENILNLFKKKVYFSIEHLEAGGIFLSDVFELSEKQRFNSFKNFLSEFEIWGSYYPAYYPENLKDDELTYHQELAIKKLRFFLNIVNDIIQPEKKNKTNNRLIQELVEDLEIINTIISNFINVLVSKDLKSSGLEDPNSSLDHGISRKGSYRSLDARLIDIKEALDKGSIPVNSNVLGHLIPVTCGHNGSLRSHELELYSVHLINFLNE